jgi:hypothetical protein
VRPPPRPAHASRRATVAGPEARAYQRAQRWSNDPARRAELRETFLANATKEGIGDKSTSVRWWLKYCVHVRKVDPFTHLTAASPLWAKVAAEHLVMDFAIWLAMGRPSGRPIAAKTIRRYVTQVCRWHLLRFRTHLCGDLDRERILAMIKGIRRIMPERPPMRRWGVRTQDLSHAMREHLQRTGEDAMWRAALSTAFCGLMRGCELATQPGETFDPSYNLTRADLTFRRDRAGNMYAVLMMRVGKSGSRLKTVPLVLRGNGTLLDPVADLLEMIRLDPVPESERATTPLFRRVSGKAITVTEVRLVVKTLMLRIGLDPRRFGAHSLRIGGATAALAAHLPRDAIQAAGRWSTDVFEVYTRASFQAGARLSTVIGSTPFNDLERGVEFIDEELVFTTAQLAPGDTAWVGRDLAEDALR